MTTPCSRLLPALLALALTQPAADAAERRATASEAAKLEAAGAAYFGRPARGEKPVLSVRPDGDHYRGTLDLGLAWTRALGITHPPAAAKESGLKFGGATFTLTPLADGRWKTVIGSLPSLRYTDANETYELLHDGVALEAITEPATGTLLSIGGRIERQTEVDERSDPKRSTHYRLKRDATGITFSGSTLPTFLPGVVDLDMPTDQATQSVSLNLSWGESPRMPPLSLNLTAGRTTGALRVHGLRLVAVLDALRRVAKSGANGGRAEKRGAEVPTTAEALIDALPLFDDAALTLTHSDASIVTGVATVLAKTFEFEFGGTGFVHRAALHLRVTAREMKIASILIPAWVVPLLPSEATVEARLSGFDFASLATYSLGHTGPAGSATAADDKRMRELYLPKGTIEIDYSGTRFAGDGWSLAMDARIDVGDTRMKGEVTLRARGLDGVVERVRTASPTDPRAATFAEGLERFIARAEKVGDEWIVRIPLDQPMKSSAGGAASSPAAPAASPTAPAVTTAPAAPPAKP